MLAENEICSVIARSELFDSDWYLRQNPDVAASGIDPVLHYVRHGERERRRPGPRFMLQGRTLEGSVSGNELYDHIMAPPRGKPRQGRVIPVVLASNENYAPYLSVTIASIARNANPDSDYVLHIFYNELKPETIDILKSQETKNLWLEPICVSRYVGEIVKRAYVHGHFSAETYFRVLIPRLLGYYHKCVYLDCDLVVNTDIKNLFNIDIKNHLVAAVYENWESPGSVNYRKNVMKVDIDYYFNAGVLLINIDYFNKFNVYDKFMDFIHEGVKFPTVDQDILNIICDKKVYKLKQTWNCMWQYYIKQGYVYSQKRIFSEFMECFENPNIIHFNCPVKPWQTDDGHFSRFFWEYAQYSPYYEWLVERCPYK